MDLYSAFQGTKGCFTKEALKIVIKQEKLKLSEEREHFVTAAEALCSGGCHHLDTHRYCMCVCVCVCVCTVACTCPPSCFIRGCSSLKRSYPWWKKVRWAYMKDNICGEDGEEYSETSRAAARIIKCVRRLFYSLISGFLIFSLIVEH